MWYTQDKNENDENACYLEHTVLLQAPAEEAESLEFN